MNLRSLSEQPPGNIPKAIGSSRESNPSRRISHLRVVTLDHVAENGLFLMPKLEVRKRQGTAGTFSKG